MRSDRVFLFSIHYLFRSVPGVKYLAIKRNSTPLSGLLHEPRGFCKSRGFCEPRPNFNCARYYYTVMIGITKLCLAARAARVKRTHKHMWWKPPKSYFSYFYDIPYGVKVYCPQLLGKGAQAHQWLLSNDCFSLFEWGSSYIPWWLLG